MSAKQIRNFGTEYALWMHQLDHGDLLLGNSVTYNWRNMDYLARRLEVSASAHKPSLRASYIQSLLNPDIDTSGLVALPTNRFLKLRAGSIRSLAVLTHIYAMITNPHLEGKRRMGEFFSEFPEHILDFLMDMSAIEDASVKDTFLLERKGIRL